MVSRQFQTNESLGCHEAIASALFSLPFHGKFHGASSQSLSFSPCFCLGVVLSGTFGFPKSTNWLRFCLLGLFLR
ncbi:hypothetical protein [Myxosarcina sp. GI1(2024)]